MSQHACSLKIEDMDARSEESPSFLDCCSHAAFDRMLEKDHSRKHEAIDRGGLSAESGVRGRERSRAQTPQNVPGKPAKTEAQEEKENQTRKLVR
jgi:hypothetical protein